MSNPKGKSPDPSLRTPPSSLKPQASSLKPTAYSLKPKASSRGFTLLEVLLAVALFGLVASLLFAAFDGVVKNARATDRMIVQYGSVQACLARITADFQGMVVTAGPSYKRPEGEDDLDPWRVEGRACSGDPETFGEVRFATNAHLDLSGEGRAGVAQIRYYVTEAEPPDTGYVLRRSDILDFDLFEQEEIVDPMLCPNVKKIAFTFFDEKGEAREEWNSESEESAFATPRAVEVVLSIALDDDPETADEGEGMVFTTRVDLPVWREKG